MRKIFTIIIISYLTVGQAYSQSYQLSLPTILVNNFGSSNLLDFSLFIPDNFEHHFSLEIQVNYGITGSSEVLVVSMSSSDITLETNHLFSTYSEAQVVLQNISFISSDFETYVQQHGVYPPGDYLICYTLIESGEPSVIHQCISIESQNTTQFYLVSPPDESTVNTPNPTFTWLYSLGLQPDNYFTINLVEIFDGQTPEQAVLSNPVLYSDMSLVPFYFYSAMSVPLENCHHYAWHVELNNLISTVEESEIWSFVMPCADTDTVRPPEYYFPLSQDDNGSVYSVKRYLNFIFDQYYDGIPDFSIDIYDLPGNLIIPFGELTEMRMNSPNTLYNGTNLFQIDLDKLGFFDIGNYLLRLKNQKQIYTLKFTHIDD